jgi:hypothetical protein
MGGEKQTHYRVEKIVFMNDIQGNRIRFEPNERAEPVLNEMWLDIGNRNKTTGSNSGSREEEEDDEDIGYMVEKIMFLSKRINEGQNVIGLEVDKIFDEAYEQRQSGSVSREEDPCLTDSEEKKQDSDYWKKHKRVDKRNKGLGRDPLGSDRYLPEQPFSKGRNLNEGRPFPFHYD